MKTLVLSFAVVLLFLLGDWGAARNAEAVVREYALAFEPLIHGRVGDEQLPHAPDPPANVAAALEEVRRNNPEYAKRVSGIILLKLHHYYLGCCRQSYEIRRADYTRPPQYQRVPENVFVAAFLAAPVRREFIPSAEAAEWAKSIKNGPLLEEIRTNLTKVREREKWLEEVLAREKQE